VFIPMTKRLLTSSYVAEGMFAVTAGEWETCDNAALRLLGSPFILFRIICVAAVNCGL
jgi:hypothetical protein